MDDEHAVDAAVAAKLNVTDDDGDIVYTVKSGNTLSHIALHYYGSAGRASFMKIAEANGIADANKIRVGQKLKIPGTAKGPEAKLG
ncbi:MAG: LysM domain-containing protein [bacterium]|nr:LysM domain-containing protein [bacterium]